MKVARAITAAMRDQRRRDIDALARTSPAAWHLILAYWCWGWDINGRGGLGRPGADL